MAQNPSFKEYVANRFYNELYDAASRHLERGGDSDELLNIRLINVFVDNLPGMKISFDVLLEAQYSNKSHRYMISCTGDLSCSLNDFTITAVEEYRGREKRLNPMTDSLVPVIRREQYDTFAQDFLKRYYRVALNEPAAIDPGVLANRMGLTIQHRNITPDLSTFGQVFFRDCEAEYYDKETSSFKKTHVNKGTIFIDPDAYVTRNTGSVNNTIVHECVHWDSTGKHLSWNGYVTGIRHTPVYRSIILVQR
jgi:hypothetical protein